MKRKHIFWGVFFILAAVVVIASQVGSFVQIGVWSIIAAVLLIAWLVSGISRVSFVEIFLSLGLLYIVFQKPLELFYISPWLLIIAALFLGIGLSLIIRKKPKAPWSGHWQTHKGENWQVAAYEPEANVEVNDDDNFPRVKVSFGTTSRYLHSQSLTRGEFSASFGGLEVYLDQAQLAPEGAELFLECSFGNIKLYVPRSWTVRDNISASLASVGNDTRMARPEAGLPPLHLTGSVSFGAIEVAYV